MKREFLLHLLIFFITFFRRCWNNFSATYFEDLLKNFFRGSSNDEKSGSHLSETRVEIVKTFFQESPPIGTDPSVLDKPEGDQMLRIYFRNTSQDDCVNWVL